jgi:Domain of unknown function (DUF5666)
MKRLRLRFTLCAALLFSACGGGVETGGTGSSPDGYVSGPITGFGSIIVGGVAIDTAGKPVFDADGARIDGETLRLGMVVEAATGPIRTDAAGQRSATAQEVRVRIELRGPVQAIEATRLTVLGQQVFLTPATVVEGGLAALVLGQTVEVHGDQDVSGQRFVATRIEAARSGGELRVRGIAQDVATGRLRIAGQGYDLSGVSAPAGLANGAFVELRVQPVQRAGLWVVTRVELRPQQVPDRDATELEGLVTALGSATQFQVNGVPVDASRARFEGLALALGARVEVRGASVGGTVQATSVRVRAVGDAGGESIDLRAPIESVNATAQTLVLRGLTVFYGAPGLELRGGTLADLVPNRRVRVRGTLDLNGLRIVATRIEFLN